MATTSTRVTIGGSEAAAACGLDPHRSRVQLWLEHTGRVPRGEAGEAAKWGTLLEPVVVDTLTAEHGVSCRAARADDAPSPRLAEWLTGHPDRIFHNGAEAGVLEVKTTGAWRAKEWEDGIPAQPLMQVQHYLALTGLRLGMVACLIGGQRLAVRRCDRDEQIIAHMLRLEEEFVRLVESDTPPDPDHRDVDALGLLYGEPADGFVQLTEEDYAVAVEWKARDAQLKKVKAQRDDLKAKLCARLGEYQVGLYEGRPLVRWTEVVTNRLNQALLKDHLPEIHEQYCDEATSRRFTVS